jgi:hypothetical protein
MCFLMINSGIKIDYCVYVEEKSNHQPSFLRHRIEKCVKEIHCNDFSFCLNCLFFVSTSALKAPGKEGVSGINDEGRMER